MRVPVQERTVEEPHSARARGIECFARRTRCERSFLVLSHPLAAWVAAAAEHTRVEGRTTWGGRARREALVAVRMRVRLMGARRYTRA